MKQSTKATCMIFCLLLSITIVCESFTVFGYGLQTTDIDKAREALKKAYLATSKLKSYRIRVESPSYKSPYIMEFVMPDQFHESYLQQEITEVGGDSYHKLRDGSWRKLPKAFRVFTGNVSASQLKAAQQTIDNANNIRILGPADLDGIPTFGYQYTVYSDRAGNKKPYDLKIWINALDSLIRKIETQRVGQAPYSYTYYDYNADIKIEPPSEYVTEFELPTESSINPGSGEYPEVRPGEGKGEESRPQFHTGVGDPSLGGGTRSKAYETSVDEKPVQLNNPPRPNYTEEARKNKIQGIVHVKVLVGPNGGVLQVRVVRGLPDGLNEEAIRSAYSVRFKPAMKAGQPVRFWVNLDIEFNLL